MLSIGVWYYDSHNNNIFITTENLVLVPFFLYKYSILNFRATCHGVEN